MDNTWEMVRVLGSGRATTVWEGRDRHLDRPVAIKQLHEDLASRPGFVDSFLAEARRMANVSDGHVLTVHAVDESSDPPRLIVERADGTARDLVEQGPLQAEQAERLLLHSLQGLAAIHRHDLVHRSIKPENLFHCGAVFKVGDFGIGASAHSPTLLFSTPRYTAPEQLDGRGSGRPDARSDLYSLGLTLYELLLGRRRFEEAVATTVDAAVSAGAAAPGTGEVDLWIRFHREAPDLPAPRELDPSVPERFSAVVARLAHKDPSARFQSAEEALRALRAPRTTDRRLPMPSDGGDAPTMALQAVEAEALARKRRRTLAIVALCVLLLSAAAAFVLVRARRFALVEITSAPSGATIRFGDEVVGTTPVDRLKVKVGTRLTLTLDGYKTATVTVTDHRQKALHAALEPVEDEPSGPALDTPRQMVEALLALRSPRHGPLLALAGGRSTTLSFHDPLTFTVEPDRDGNLVLFTVSPGGNLHLLYPGPRADSFPVDAGERLTLPLPEDRRAGFNLSASSPAGRETVFALTLDPEIGASPPSGTAERPEDWLVTYPFSGPDSPAAELARWVAKVRTEHPEQTGLATLELDIEPDRETP